MSLEEQFDVLIIGCGMSGIAAGIRLSMYQKRVLIVDSHNAPGGLNGFYFKDGRKFDVGLHAVTNYVEPGIKGTPLQKLLRQLRINRDELDLCPQWGSRIAFPEVSLRFTNDFTVLEQEIAEAFPAQIDRFRRFVQHMDAFDALAYEGPVLSARSELGAYISDPLLVDMLMCPLCYYGSARNDNDMDFDQFIVMFRSVFREGFCRPFEGVRKIIKVLLDRYRSLGGKRKMGCGVARLLKDGQRIAGAVLEDGSQVYADLVLSSAGLGETLKLVDAALVPTHNIGTMSFVESIQVISNQPESLGMDDTIVFFSRSDKFRYETPAEPLDLGSGVICVPNNYAFGSDRALPEGMIRITAQADYNYWSRLNDADYLRSKEEWFMRLQQVLTFAYPKLDLAALNRQELARDVFTPKTVERFTRHFNGAVYGAPQKKKSGQTDYENLILIGTDQGFLGIIGSLLSGISMANRYGLTGI
ncbi:MAG: NAD(P)/FAD-dependent oxidoreductase [Opitutales bacterium]|nr:NAD(P)/FAD-dependent oxidoreductase [Opitutales bacterium]